MRPAFLLLIVMGTAVAFADGSEAERVALAAGLQGGYRDHGGHGDVKAISLQRRTLMFSATGRCSDAFLAGVLKAVTPQRLRGVGFLLLMCADDPEPSHMLEVPR